MRRLQSDDRMHGLIYRRVSVLDVGCGYGGLTGIVMLMGFIHSGSEHHPPGGANSWIRNPYEGYRVCRPSY